MKDRVLVWFSCGAASACVAKLASILFGPELVVVYCDTMATEHPDNQRFFDDVAAWIGRPIQKIASSRYESVDDVFAKRHYMAGRAGAPCTIEMKKRPRFDFQQATDTHCFGMTADETKRIQRFEQGNPELKLRWLLAESGLEKQDCLDMVAEAGIVLPAMYGLGYKNNNCIGCVKATSPAYWNKIRQDFPEVFALRTEQSKALGCRLVRVKGERKFLHELAVENVEVVEEDLSCGPQCGASEEEIQEADAARVDFNQK